MSGPLKLAVDRAMCLISPGYRPAPCQCGFGLLGKSIDVDSEMIELISDSSNDGVNVASGGDICESANKQKPNNGGRVAVSIGLQACARLFDILALLAFSWFFGNKAPRHLSLFFRKPC